MRNYGNAGKKFSAFLNFMPCFVVRCLSFDRVIIIYIEYTIVKLKKALFLS